MKLVSQIILLTLTGGCLSAQTPSATLSGSTVDASEARVPHVALTLKNLSTGYARKLASGPQGEFTFPSVPPGTYELTAEIPGFATALIEPIVVQAGDQSLILVRLRVAGATDTVDVQAEAPLVREGMGGGTVVDRQFIENQPLKFSVAGGTRSRCHIDLDQRDLIRSV
jgi:hypothetical protein